MASFLSLSLPKLNLIKASSAASTTSTTTTSLLTPEAKNKKFGRKGNQAHVTSYKPKVYWKDDGFEEILYTVPPADGTTGPYKAKGGIGLVLNEVLQPGAKEILPSTVDWTVSDVDSDSIDALQVELSCASRLIDITYVVTLYPVRMATAVIAKNKTPSLSL